MLETRGARGRAGVVMSLPAMARRIGWRRGIGIAALLGILAAAAFIVLAGTCDRNGTQFELETWSYDDISFKHPARARISVVFVLSVTCVEEEQHECNPQLEVLHESSGSVLWLDRVTGAEIARRVRTENGADPADVNDLFDHIAGSVRIRESGDQ